MGVGIDKEKDNRTIAIIEVEDFTDDFKTRLLIAHPEVISAEKSIDDADIDEGTILIGGQIHWFVGVTEEEAIFWAEGNSKNEGTQLRVPIQKSNQIDVKQKGNTIKIAKVKEAEAQKIKRIKTNLNDKDAKESGWDLIRKTTAKLKSGNLEDTK